jgi:hypothetical protein
MTLGMEAGCGGLSEERSWAEFTWDGHRLMDVRAPPTWGGGWGWCQEPVLGARCGRWSCLLGVVRASGVRKGCGAGQGGGREESEGVIHPTVLRAPGQGGAPRGKRPRAPCGVFRGSRGQGGAAVISSVRQNVVARQCVGGRRGGVGQGRRCQRGAAPPHTAGGCCGRAATRPAGRPFTAGAAGHWVGVGVLLCIPGRAPGWQGRRPRGGRRRRQPRQRGCRRRRACAAGTCSQARAGRALLGAAASVLKTPNQGNRTTGWDRRKRGGGTQGPGCAQARPAAGRHGAEARQAQRGVCA